MTRGRGQIVMEQEMNTGITVPATIAGDTRHYK